MASLFLAACGDDENAWDWLFDVDSSAGLTEDLPQGIWHGSFSEELVRAQMRAKIGKDTFTLATRCFAAHVEKHLTVGVEVPASYSDTTITLHGSARDERFGGMVCWVELEEGEIPYQVNGKLLTLGEGAESVSLSKVSDLLE